MQRNWCTKSEQNTVKNLKLKVYAKRSRSNWKAPVCLRQKLFWYSCIDQKSRFMETGHQGRVICAFTDLRKAFDVINDATLLDRLQAYSVRGTALEWMRSYLYDRTQFVSFCGCGSSGKEITWDVPQGSVLGLTLFNLHINGITSVCQYCYVAL